MDFEEREIRTTSRNTAEVDPIILRETTITRLVFKPMLLKNPNDEKASVKGTFVFQKKGKNESWDDISGKTLSSFKKGEGYKLEVHSAELRHLMRELFFLYDLRSREEIKQGVTKYIKADAQLSQIANVTEEEFEKFIKLNPRGWMSLYQQFIKWINTPGQDGRIVDRLFKLKPHELEKINDLINQSSFQRLQKFWMLNYNNSNEEVWQKLFNENSYLLSSIIKSPVIHFKGKSYVGGKNLDNRGGKLIDYIFKNTITNNVTLIEIKTPETKLLGNKYRGVFPASNDLSGSIIQILNYKNELSKDYYQLKAKEKESFYTFNPECLIIAGRTDQLDSEEKIESFELFRTSLSNIRIITYDELFENINQFVKEYN